MLHLSTRFLQTVNVSIYIFLFVVSFFYGRCGIFNSDLPIFSYPKLSKILNLSTKQMSLEVYLSFQDPYIYLPYPNDNCRWSIKRQSRYLGQVERSLGEISFLSPSSRASIKDVDKFSEFWTPPPLPCQLFFSTYYQLETLTNFRPFQFPTSFMDDPLLSLRRSCTA